MPRAQRPTDWALVTYVDSASGAAMAVLVNAATRNGDEDMTRRALKVAIATPMSAVSLSLGASPHYVDFDTGSDTNNGEAPSSPWKSAPGDPAATGNAASKALGPGDTALLRGGVVYRGRLVLTKSGSSAATIPYKGDGWRSSRAVIEGAEPYQPIWTPCASAVACGGKPKYAKIDYAAAPSGYTGFFTALYEDGDLLWYSHRPSPADPLYHDEIGDFYTVPYPSTNVVQNHSSITDPRVLTQQTSTFWAGTSVAG